MPPTFLRRPSSGTGRPPRPTLTSAFASAFLTLSCAGLIATQAPTPARAAAPDFIAFESGHVRPLALSADGTKLFAVNTPNNTLEVFNVTPAGLQLAARVPVGSGEWASSTASTSTACPSSPSATSLTEPMVTPPLWTGLP